MNTTTYAEAGVDVKQGDDFVDNIKTFADNTFKVGVMNKLGTFASLFSLKAINYKDPILVSSTDGVGSKLFLLQKIGLDYVAGMDLVAMSTNDILCHGAQPLYFLDYLAVGSSVKDENLTQFVRGIADGCNRAGCALVGGETAYLSKHMPEGKYEAAGFAVGAVEKINLLPNGIRDGDYLIGLHSSGLHCTGFSMLGEVIDFPKEMYDQVVAPCKDYVKDLEDIIPFLSGIANITGGGFQNVKRIMPDDHHAFLDITWKVPSIYEYIKSGKGTFNQLPVERDEMLKTFNCGIGMVLVVNPLHMIRVAEHLGERGVGFNQIGLVRKMENKRPKPGSISISGMLGSL